MTATEWLEKNNKRPYKEELYPFWDWAERLPDEPETFSDEDDLALPSELFNLLKAKRTYPNCKMYESEKEALEDFAQAYEQWILKK